jgi:hypothetical protein
VLLAACDRALEAFAEARVHPHELIARPGPLLLVAGLAWRGGELAWCAANRETRSDVPR